METKTLFLSLQHVCQIFLSLYGFRYSFTAITNLQKYEARTKKLAKWSKEVENQLFKTRMTQGTGIITVSLSLTVALTILTARKHFPQWAIYLASPMMLVLIIGARMYIKNFWTPSKDGEGKDVGLKVPLLPSMDEYNLAVERTEDLLKIMEYLEYSWALTSFVTGMLGKKWAEG